MGGPEQLAKAAGALAGLGLAIAAAAPFTGVPPRGASGSLAPAQIEVRVQPAGEFTVTPIGTVLKPAPFPQPGERGGPTLAVSIRNITGTSQRVSVRLTGVAPELDAVATLRGSVAGAVVLRGPLRDAGAWTKPAGVIASGESSTLRIRFKLRKGIDPDQFAGRLDIRVLEIKGTAVGQRFDAPDDEQQIVPGTEGTTPATTPDENAAPTPTTVPTPTATPFDPDAPVRRGPDEGPA